MRASQLQPSSLQYSSFLKDGGSKAGSSHFNEQGKKVCKTTAVQCYRQLAFIAIPCAQSEMVISKEKRKELQRCVNNCKNQIVRGRKGLKNGGILNLCTGCNMCQRYHANSQNPSVGLSLAFIIDWRVVSFFISVLREGLERMKLSSIFIIW